MSKVSLKYIANTLGLSVSTVSKALKGYYDVSPTTRSRVKKLAEELNYEPNFFAQNLRNNESKTIGLIIPKIVHHFFANIISGVIQSATKNGYLVITLQTGESFETEKEQIDLLMSKNVDGILLSLSENTVNYNHIKNIISRGTPIVLYDKISRSIDCSKVIVNDVNSAFTATEHLIKTGCKNIAHARGTLKPQTTIDRFNGYKKALQAYNIPFDKSLVFETSHQSPFEDGKEIAKRIYNSDKNIDGIFAMTDLLAIGILVGLIELGVSVPDDISIIGFSNWFITETTSPTLSTINQPGFIIGQEAFNLLLKEIKAKKTDETFEFETIEVPTSLVLRKSTKPLF